MQAVRPSAPSLKEKQRQKREELIIQAAEEVLLEKGYYDTSMDEIAARVGIAKGTIYKHFPGKEDLVLGIFKRNLQALIQGIDEIVYKEPTPRAKLKALLLFVYTGFFSKETQLLSSIYNGVDLKRLLAEKGGDLHEPWKAIVSRIKQLLEEGKAVGEFDASIPTRVMLYSLFCLFSPKVYDRMLLGEELTHGELINHLWRVYLNGIAHHPHP